MQSALIADHLTKQYTLGALAHETMIREALVNLVRRPSARRLREKHNDTILALNDVSFSVETGGVVGIIGRNGSGKSTLLKILSRITYPTSGQIHVNGRVASLLEVGTGFHEELTGRENIYLNGSILGMKKREIDARLDEIIEFAGIGRFLDTPIKRYSSGMRLRLGFAVAAHLLTHILLVDEVLAVGDFEFQKKCLSKMENLHQGGRTVLFVSHNLTAVEHLCPRTIWIDQGRVRQDGATEGVVHDYLAHFSANSRDPSNLADAKSREGTGQVRIVGIEFLDVSGAAMPVVRSGDPVTIRVHYEARTEVHGAQFGIEIFKPGLHIAALRSVNAGQLIPYLTCGRGYIDAVCDCVNLVPGRYSITLWAKGPIADGNSKLYWDVIEGCATLDVEPSDFYGMGSGVEYGSGIVLLPCHWEMSGAPESPASGEAVARFGRELRPRVRAIPPAAEQRK